MELWYVLTGAALDELKQRTAERLAAGDRGDEREFDMYAAKSKVSVSRPPIRCRCAALPCNGNHTSGHEGTLKAVAANWECFGAPAALFCYIDREMGSAQWADVGMYLQTIMLLLRAEGLHSCPQMAWSVYRRTVAELVSPPIELVLFCGMSIGFEDANRNHVRTDRAPLAETVTFVD